MGMLQATSMLSARPVLSGACPDDEMLHRMRNIAVGRISIASARLGSVDLKEYNWCNIKVIETLYRCSLSYIWSCFVKRYDRGAPVTLEL